MHVVVVGAGILGASTGFHLARAGAQVTIVDQAHDGRATAAGAGIICPWVSGAEDAAFYRLYVEGARYYGEVVPALAELGETDLGFRRVGALVVSNDADELAAFDRVLSAAVPTRRRWATTSLLSPRETGALFPPLRADLAGLHVANGARVDGRRMAAGLLRAAQRLGATSDRGPGRTDRCRRSRHRRQAARRDDRGGLCGCHRRRLGAVAAAARGCRAADRAAARPDRASASAGPGHARLACRSAAGQPLPAGIR